MAKGAIYMYKMYFKNELEAVNIVAINKLIKAPVNADISSGTINYFVHELLNPKKYDFRIISNRKNEIECILGKPLVKEKNNGIKVQVYRWHEYYVHENSEEKIIPTIKSSDFIKALKQSTQGKPNEKTLYIFIDEISDLYGLGNTDKEDFVLLLREAEKRNIRFVIFGKDIEKNKFTEEIIAYTQGFCKHDENVSKYKLFITDKKPEW